MHTFCHLHPHTHTNTAHYPTNALPFIAASFCVRDITWRVACLCWCGCASFDVDVGVGVGVFVCFVGVFALITLNSEIKVKIFVKHAMFYQVCMLRFSLCLGNVTSGNSLYFGWQMYAFQLPYLIRAVCSL